MTREAAYAYLGKAYLRKENTTRLQAPYIIRSSPQGCMLLYPISPRSTVPPTTSVQKTFGSLISLARPVPAHRRKVVFDLACFSAGVPVWYTKYASITMAFGMSAYPSTSFASFMGTHDGKTSQRYKETLMDYGTAAATGYVTLPIQSCCEGYIKVKGLCLAADLVGAFLISTPHANTVYMRYAEVLLNHAEAVAKVARQVPSGLDALNKVRERAGLTDAPSLDMDNATYGVKAERRAELYGEGQHFIDLVRWGDAAKELVDCGKTSSSFNSVNADGTAISPRQSQVATVSRAARTNSSQSRQPTSTAIRNLKQNTGW